MSIQEQDAILHQNYNFLNEERYRIEKFEKDFETLNSAAYNSQLIVTSNYYRYIVLMFISILLIFLLIKYSGTGQQGGGEGNFKKESFFLFCLMLVFLSISKIFNNYESYIFISILVISYIFIKIKLNQ
jgi:hypothetical protein